MKTLLTTDINSMGVPRKAQQVMPKSEWMIPQNYPPSLCSDFMLTKSLSDSNLVSHILWLQKEDTVDDRYFLKALGTGNTYIFYCKSIPKWKCMNLNCNISQTSLRSPGVLKNNRFPSPSTGEHDSTISGAGNLYFNNTPGNYYQRIYGKYTKGIPSQFLGYLSVSCKFVCDLMGSWFEDDQPWRFWTSCKGKD